VSKELLTVFDGLYQKKVGAKYPVNGGKDGALLKQLRAIYSDEDITRFMRAYFEMDDPFFAETGWSLGCFRSCLPKVIAWVNRKGSVAVNWQKAPRELATRGMEIVRRDPTWDPERDCPHEGHDCDTRGICQAYEYAARKQRGDVA
jgi:hypothetical protein